MFAHLRRSDFCIPGADHLSDCPDCQRRLEGLDTPDNSVLAALRRPAPTPTRGVPTPDTPTDRGPDTDGALPGSVGRVRPKKGTQPKPVPRVQKPSADRAKIEVAERALADLREQQSRSLAELNQREQSLRQERQAREHEIEQRQKALAQEHQTVRREFDRRETALRHEREAAEREFARHEAELEKRLAAARRAK